MVSFLELEKMLLKKIPGCNLGALPHIYSKNRFIEKAVPFLR